MGRRDRGPRRLWPEPRFLVQAQVGRREFRLGLGWSVVVSWGLERPAEMLRTMEVVKKLRLLLFRVPVLVRSHVEGRCLPVVVTFAVEAQETTGKALAPVKTRKAMASVSELAQVAVSQAARAKRRHSCHPSHSPSLCLYRRDGVLLPSSACHDRVTSFHFVSGRELACSHYDCRCCCDASCGHRICLHLHCCCQDPRLDRLRHGRDRDFY